MIKTTINKEDSVSPFKSKAQRKFMHSQRPEVAKKWELESSSPGELPEKVTRKKKRK